ncbi:unnamed protein product [Coffea canephora]|uniref:Homeobox-leucine zipper protein n=1 Tax=Coffea canephora TaxID=49390 RepID=A0A068TY73_COFCA|nr:unnamed protein product [Coffea canephora]
MTCTAAMAFFPANFMLQTSHHDQDHHDSQQPPTSLSTPILSSCAPQDFHGVASLLGKRSMSFSGVDVCDQENHGEDDLSDDGSQMGEKKRRLNMEQVKTLEKNFELGNKLEPERKMQLARALGLQPRQIAIWFQNRRARWKTKQLEKDYEVLKRQFEAIKAENDALQAQNQKLHAEISALKNREPTESINLNKETEGSCSNRSENSSDIKLDISRTPAIDRDSPLSTHPTASRSLFPTSIRSAGGMTTTQLFHNSTRPDLQCQKMDHSTVKEESLCNMFGIDDQAGFWPWLEQQHFN